MPSPVFGHERYRRRVPCETKKQHGIGPFVTGRAGDTSGLSWRCGCAKTVVSHKFIMKPIPAMVPFWSRFPKIAEQESRTIKLLQPVGELPVDDYAFVELYCNDPDCDCRRVILQVRAGSNFNQVLATINFGWEPQSFYQEWLHGNAQGAREICGAALDPINSQSKYAPALLEIFRKMVRTDMAYVARLARHYQMFRKDTQGQTQPAPDNSVASKTEHNERMTAEPDEWRIPVARRERFVQVASSIGMFAQQHLDEELTGFAHELWRRICRRKSDECMSGQPNIWAASVIHVIARMNFLFDRQQPVHLTFDIICDFFQVSKATVGGKATKIERALHLRQHSEPGLCRRQFVEDFTEVRLSNGMVLSWSMAKKMGYVPPDANVEDLLR